MRRIIFTLSAVFFGAAMIVTALALSLPSRQPAPLVSPRPRAAPSPVETALRDSLEKLAREQAASQALVEELRETIASLQGELASGSDRESLEQLTREQAASQAQFEELQRTLGSLRAELDGRNNQESLEKLAREQAASQALVEELQGTIASLQAELTGRKDREPVDRQSPGQAGGLAQGDARQRSVARLQPFSGEDTTSATGSPAERSSPARGAVPRGSVTGFRYYPPENGTPEGGRVIAILGGGSFKPGQSALSPALEASVRRVLPDIVSFPDYRVLVEGHSDSNPIGSSLGGTFASNADLSLTRAEAVARSLEDAGVHRDRIMITGHGDSRPLASNSTAEGRSENRRVEIWVVPASAAPAGSSAGSGGR